MNRNQPDNTILRRALLAAMCMLGVCAWAVPLQAVETPGGGAVETTVGIEGVYYARADESTLQAKPVDDDGPVVLRIAEVTEDGNSAIYELCFIATRPGNYDLRDYLVGPDGEPAAGLQPMPVVVGELLPADHKGDLQQRGRPEVGSWLPYRTLLLAAYMLWLLPPIVLVIRSLARRRERPRAAGKSEPTLADQLRPLVEEALAGELSAAGQARLELLLITHWRRRLGLTDCSPSEALEAMRDHEEAGKLLRNLVRWLHQPPGRHTVDLAALLEPYKTQAAVDESRLGESRVESRAEGRAEEVTV